MRAGHARMIQLNDLLHLQQQTRACVHVHARARAPAHTIDHRVRTL
jgi:hypothetical protein